MQLPTQQQFVTDCLSKYRWESIPADQQWEAAHFPLPQCSGEGETVQLWSADHTVQGLLQSVEFDHLCFYYKANGKDLLNLQTYYPQYLELFQQLKSQFNSRRGKIGGKKAVELKLGFHGRSAEQKTAHNKKAGKIGGKKAVELKLGVHGRSAEQMTADSKIGGKKAVITNKANGTGAFFDPKLQSAAGKKGAKITGAQKWQCLVTGFISSPGPLTRYQKKRGIDTKLRVKLVIQSLSS